MSDPIERLKQGFRDFRANYYDGRPDFYKDLVEKGQSPKVMVIACADSRVNPSIIAKAEPGELFVVRNVANLVPPHQPDGAHHGTSAALEFAVRDLGVEHIIIIGHSHCGGIRHLCMGHADGQPREFIDSWISILGKAGQCPEVDEAGLREMERKALVVSLANLTTFPWIKERIDAGKLAVHGWWFDLEAGELLAYDPQGGGFESVEA